MKRIMSYYVFSDGYIACFVNNDKTNHIYAGPGETIDYFEGGMYADKLVGRNIKIKYSTWLKHLKLKGE